MDGREEAMLLCLFSAVVFLLIRVEAADEDDVKAGTEHDVIVLPELPGFGHTCCLHRLQHSSQ